MSYQRVIPRDLFNEAKLLKCMGMLSLAVLDCMLPQGVRVQIEDSGEPFQIELSDDGRLYVANLETFVNGRITIFSTNYNSKRSYPFHCVHPDTEELIAVFGDDGKFTEEFKALCELQTEEV